MPGIVFRGAQCEHSSDRDAQQDHALVRLLEEPPQDRADVLHLLLHADALRVPQWRIAAAALFPVTHQEIPLEIEQTPILPDLVQQRQAWTSLNDQQRRTAVAFGTEADSLAG